jgi:hypothetical protein
LNKTIFTRSGRLQALVGQLLDTEPPFDFLQGNRRFLLGSTLKEPHQLLVIPSQFNFAIEIVNLSKYEFVAFGRT